MLKGMIPVRDMFLLCKFYILHNLITIKGWEIINSG